MICSIIRTIQLRNLAEKAEPTYIMADHVTWWTFEAYMVLTVVDNPTLRPLAQEDHVLANRKGS